MIFISFRKALILAWLAGLLAVNPLAAAPPAIRDGAHLFSAEAVKKAEARIADLHRRFGKHLVIESFQSIPWYKRLFLSKDPDAYCAELAKKRADSSGPNSIYVLICQEPLPLRVEVAAGSKLREKGFTASDTDSLRERLLARFRQGHFDDGLQEAIPFVRNTLDANLEEWGPPPEPFPWEGVLATIAIMVGFWFCSELISVFSSRTAEGPVAVEPSSYGGGGSYLAGLFASMNTRWFADLVRTLRDEHRGVHGIPPVAITPPFATEEEHPVLTHAGLEAKTLGDIPHERT